MARYIKSLLGPLILLLVTAITSLDLALTVGVLALAGALRVFAISWAGWLLVTRLKYSVGMAAYVGPLLLFIDLVGLFPLTMLAGGDLASSFHSVPVDKLVLGSQFLTELVAMLFVWVIFVPISFAVAAFGAYIGTRVSRGDAHA